MDIVLAKLCLAEQRETQYEPRLKDFFNFYSE
jgi:hypothetical protein